MSFPKSRIELEGEGLTLRGGEDPGEYRGHSGQRGEGAGDGARGLSYLATAARASILSAFNAAQGYVNDAD
jgi:hypothetical protein